VNILNSYRVNDLLSKLTGLEGFVQHDILSTMAIDFQEGLSENLVA
jgi:hypothetical protein